MSGITTDTTTFWYQADDHCSPVSPDWDDIAWLLFDEKWLWQNVVSFAGENRKKPEKFATNEPNDGLVSHTDGHLDIVDAVCWDRTSVAVVVAENHEELLDLADTTLDVSQSFTINWLITDASDDTDTDDADVPVQEPRVLSDSAKRESGTKKFAPDTCWEIKNVNWNTIGNELPSCADPDGDFSDEDDATEKHANEPTCTSASHWTRKHAAVTERAVLSDEHAAVHEDESRKRFVTDTTFDDGPSFTTSWDDTNVNVMLCEDTASSVVLEREYWNPDAYVV